MTYDNTNRGTLGKNKRKEKDTQPEYTGKCDIDGKMYWINGWVKEANGSKFFSLSFKAQDATAQQAAPAKPSRDDDLSEIPF